MDKPTGTQVDDILFSLRATHPGGFDGPWDAATVEATIATAEKFAAEQLAPGREEADRQGCALKNGQVAVPQSYHQAYAEYVACGLHLLGLPEANGGLEAPFAVRMAVNEILAAADHSFQMMVALTPGAAGVIAHLCPAELSAQLIAPMAAGESLATMCLTEPQAGSDLSCIMTSATRSGNAWTLNGTKIFISGGGQPLSTTALHLVLARTGTGEGGRARLGLFAVPDTDRVVVARLEHKLGLHGCPTSELRFENADAVLIGEDGQGLPAMFGMMNEARIDVAVQAVAHAGAASALAEDYAFQRQQGRDATGAPVPIARHGDVRRMLNQIASATLGSRAMCLLAMSPEHASLAPFLIPVCKAFVTDRGVEAIDTAMQVMGGYSYLPEYGIEQHWRDARITRIYEGANGIMAMTLAKRLLEVENGALADRFESVVRAVADDAIQEVADMWSSARRTIEGAGDRGVAAYPFLTLTGHLWSLFAWSGLRDSADSAADPERIRMLASHAAREALADAHAQARRVQDLVQQSLNSATGAGS